MSNEFDRFADAYDQTLKASFPCGLDEDEYYARYKVDFVAKVCGGRTIARLLDFGCGAGRSLGFLVAAFPQAQVHGYDPSAESIRIAAQRVPRAIVSDDWELIRQQRFDVGFAANVFHHIARAEVSPWLARCAEVLAPQGSLFVFEHNPRNPVTRRVFERCPFDAGAAMIPRQELVDLAGVSGLKVKAASYTLFFPKPLKVLRPLERLLGCLPLGAQYCLELVRA